MPIDRSDPVAAAWYGMDMYLASLVLCHLVVRVLLAISALAVCAAGLRYVHLVR
jgi:hypothetical protein